MMHPSMRAKLRVLRITVDGTPRAQGSMTLRVVGNRAMGRYSNPTIEHRNLVTACFEDAIDAIDGYDMLDEPVAVEIVCFFARPKKHYYTGKRSTVLRDDAPVYHRNTPDASKLGRLIEDSATVAGVWKDDSQVCDLSVSKRYAQPGETGYTVINIFRMGE